MLKKLLVFVIVFFSLNFTFYLLPFTSARGADEFFIDSSVEYKIETSGKTQVKHTIGLENAFSTLYVKEYSLVLEGIDIAYPQVLADGKPLKFNLKKESDKVTFEIFFENPVVGKGKAQNFEILYDNFSFAQKTGEVWEISIPKVADSKAFRNYSVKLLVPDSIGSEAYVSPKPFQKLRAGSDNVYIFDKDRISKTGVTAGFGQFQVFSFTLNYHLENPLARNATSEIALPPDTAFQKVHYQSLNPEPKKVSLDRDGNWIAVYELSPRQKIDIVAQGAVQIFSGVISFPRLSGDYLTESLKETKYWQTSDSQIKALATQLKTARNIYDYVSQNLSYDYARVKPNVTRLGAVGALQNPSSAICMEFTDLFIALARAAGIPAREINGYAYTENPKIQPLSLVSDVLHSWPEYWDETRGAWIPVDPTWASTTGGVDYFNKLDLRHFTFVIHGIDPEKPYPAGSYKLGTNPQKDVYISFGQIPEEKTESLEIEVTNTRPVFPINLNIKVVIKNRGSTAYYNLKPLVSFDNEIYQTESIDVLPPFGTFEFNFKVPFSFLGRNTPENIVISAADREVSVPSFKSWVIIYNLILIFILIFLSILLILVKLKKINIRGFREKIYAKFNSKLKSSSKL